ncbi:MAG: hypothetical protein Q9166_004905 [cf. Caloplaca sp. 2 TL-2023]
MHASEPSGLSTSYIPGSNAKQFDYPTAPPSSRPQQKPYGTAPYLGPRLSYPIYYNTSSTLGPTATYGTAPSSGFPLNNYSFPQPTDGSTVGSSFLSTCPPPSTVTIQNTIVAPPITVTAPPITVTVTSTVSASQESSPQVTPTMTITMTITVCMDIGPNTDLGGNNSPAVTSLNGGAQSGGEIPVESEGLDSPVPTGSKPNSVILMSSAIPTLIASENFPQKSGSGSMAQQYQPPHANNSGYQEPAIPRGTGNSQPTANPKNPATNLEQPLHTNLFPGTGGYGSRTSSQYPGLGEEATTLPATSTIFSYPIKNGSTAGQSFDYASGSLGTQKTYVSYQPSNAVTSNEGKGFGDTQTTSGYSTSQAAYGTGSAIPSGHITGQGGSGNAFTGASITLPDGFSNNTSIDSGFVTGSYTTGTNPVSTSLTDISEPLPSYGQGGSDTNILPPYATPTVIPPVETSVGYASGGSGFAVPSDPTNIGAYGTPPFVNSTTSAPVAISGTEAPYQPYPNTISAFQNPTSPPAATASSDLPPFVNSTTSTPSAFMPGTGVPYEPFPNTVAAPQGSGLPPPTTNSFPPYQPPPDHAPFRNLTSTTPDLENPSTSGSGIIGDQTTSDTGTVYTTMTQEVVPYPVGSSANSSSIQGTGSPYTYDNAPPMTTKDVSVAGQYGNEIDDGVDSTSATSSDNGPIPTGFQALISNPEDLVSNTSSSSSIAVDNPIPSPSPPPPSSSANTTTSDPPCIPSPENLPIKVDFNLEQPGTPLPTPYHALSISGFDLNTNSPSPHLTAPASTTLKSIAIAPPAKHFNLTSIALACSSPPCDITIWGTQVASYTASGAAAGTLLTSRTRVEAAAEGVAAYTAVEGLDGKGWIELEKINFVATGVGGEDQQGVGIDDLVYTVRMEKECESEDKDKDVKGEGEGEKGLKIGGLVDS